MSGQLIAGPWPTRVPGRPYLWVLSLTTEEPAARCAVHDVPTNRLGVCDDCVSEWRRSLGADPEEWFECRVCGLPVHPAVEADGFDSCPSCVADESTVPAASGGVPW